jgi:hypothetical protein
MFYRFKNFRRVASRYDRLATNYLASICLAATVDTVIGPDLSPLPGGAHTVCIHHGSMSHCSSHAAFCICQNLSATP